jgi:outer membrane immunogenic protein
MNITKAGAWLAATAMGGLLAATPSMAAGLPVKAKPIVAATFDWSGVYVGVHAGYGGGMKDWLNFNGDFVARGPLIGGQAGINKQLGSFVFGVELDGAWSDFKGSQDVRFGGPAVPLTFALNPSSKINGIATLTGRAGLAADRWFVFAKGGFAALHETHGFLLAGTAQNNATLTLGGDEVRYAPTLGFGAEYALFGNWSIKGEYDYIHVDARNRRLDGTVTNNGVIAPAFGDARIEQAIHLAKIGVNYRWGGVAVDPGFAPVPPAAGTNWTGGYVGVEGGYGSGNKQWPTAAGFFGVLDPVSYGMSGWLGGGTIGANAQAGSLVFGVEGEILGTGIKGSGVFATAPLGGSLTMTYDSKIDWLALASARAGFVVGNSVLLYGKGGVAVAQETHNVGMSFNIPGQGTVVSSVTAKPVHTGVVAGVGGEYAVAPNWSVKLEYDYIRMIQQGITATGTANVNLAAGGGGVGTIDMAQGFSKLNQDLHLVKFGVNYHFNPVQAVVAKY